MCQQLKSVIPSSPIFSKVLNLLFVNSHQTKHMHQRQDSSEVSRAPERTKIKQKTDSDKALIPLLQGAFEFSSNCSQSLSFELVELLLAIFFSEIFPSKIQHDRK